MTGFVNHSESSLESVLSDDSDSPLSDESQEINNEAASGDQPIPKRKTKADTGTI